MKGKLWFYDFDRTLCAHNCPIWAECLDIKDELMHCFQNSDLFTNGDKPIKALQWHVSTRDPNDRLFCLTHQHSNLRERCIKEFLKQHYGIAIEYLSVSSPELKITMIEAVAQSLNVVLDDCYLVEDNMHTAYLACKAGIHGIHISSIYGDYEDHLDDLAAST